LKREKSWLKNTMLASAGYSWTVIPVEDRSAYMKCLEKASIEEDIYPFTKFIEEKMETAPIEDA